jgi:superfamily II DNA or RNA helicase
MLNELAACLERTHRIVHEIEGLIHTGRQMLILTDRRTHIMDMKSMLLERGIPATSIGIIIGGMKDADQEISKQRNIIFSTYPMCSEAIDIPTLSIVVLATPRQDVRQSVARGMRTKSAAVEPLIVDVLDKRSMWIRFWYCRHRFYKDEGYNIQFENKDTSKVEIDQNCQPDLEDFSDFEEDAPKVEKRKRNDDIGGSVVKKQKECPF